MRHAQLRAVEALQPMDQHGTVDLIEHVATDLDVQVGADTENVSVERRMMQATEREAIRYVWAALRMAVLEYVGRLQELGMTEAAD